MSTGTDSFAYKKLKSGNYLIGNITYDTFNNSYYYDIFIHSKNDIEKWLYSSKHFNADKYNKKDIIKEAKKKFNRYFKIKNKMKGGKK